MIVTWRDAENACARYLREAGSGGAQVTPAGADGGIDVIGEHVIAQVKFVTAKVGSTTVQQFAGATIRHPTQTRKVFFSSAGFTDPAIRLAKSAGIELVVFRDSGAFWCLVGTLPRLHLSSDDPRTVATQAASSGVPGPGDSSTPPKPVCHMGSPGSASTSSAPSARRTVRRRIPVESANLVETQPDDAPEGRWEWEYIVLGAVVTGVLLFVLGIIA